MVCGRYFGIEQKPHVVFAIWYDRWPTFCARAEIFYVAMALKMISIYKQMNIYSVGIHLRPGVVRHVPTTNRTYREWTRMKQITGLLDFIDEHIDQHRISVIQILT